MIDGAEQKIGRAGLECRQTEAALLIDRDGDHRHILATRQHAKTAGEFRPVHAGHLVIGDHQIGWFVEIAQGFFRFAIGLDANILRDGRCEPREDVAVGDAIVRGSLREA